MMDFVKKFNEFHSINESFNSNKLRNIINQNGYPKYDWDKQLLHDITDDDVVGVVNDVDEYKEKFNNDGRKFNKDAKTFFIELENGKLLVLSNVGILKDEIEKTDDETLWDRVKRMKEDRRKFNQGKYAEDDHDRHMKRVREIMDRRTVEFLKQEENAKELSKDIEGYISEYVENYEYEEDSIGSFDIIHEDFNIVIGNYNFAFDCTVDYSVSESWKSHGEYMASVTCDVKDIRIFDEEDNEFMIDDIYTEDTSYEFDIEIGVYDYYQMYGVSRSDFF